MIEYSIRLLLTTKFRLDEHGIQIDGFVRSASHAWGDIAMAGVQRSHAKSDDRTLRQMGEMLTSVLEDILRTRESTRFILCRKKDGTLVHLHCPEHIFADVAALFQTKLDYNFDSTERDYFELRRSLGLAVDPVSLAVGVAVSLGIAVLMVSILAWWTGAIP